MCFFFFLVCIVVSQMMFLAVSLSLDYDLIFCFVFFGTRALSPLLRSAIYLLWSTRLVFIHNISDFGETIRFSVLLVAPPPVSSVVGFITDMWSRDIIPWEMSIVSCAALLWWKNLSE